MDTMKKQHVEFLLNEAKRYLANSKQLAAVRLSLSEIDNALTELAIPDKPTEIKKPIELYTDNELLEEIKKRMKPKYIGPIA